MSKKKKNLQLAKSLTTVTPLSKFLAMLLFVVLPVIAFLLGMNYQKNIYELTDPIVGQVVVKVS